MTSSLVGSEMCIRDSQATGKALGNEGAALSICGKGVDWDKVMALEEGAVSYTHLTLPTICSV
eukprot:4896337-Prorocentrum_lima.AAC.1